jgi:hypothetical protein
MKNIAHFMSGLLLASFVPGVMDAATRGSVLIALGGACAMLPDMLDFRLARYLERRDADIAPDPLAPDAQALADALAAQMLLAEQQQRPRIVQFHPTRRGPADWWLYTLRFDMAQGDVVIRLDHDGSAGRAHVGRLDYTYEGDLHIEELGGPSLRFCPSPEGMRIEFLPWHRQWTHSLVLAALVGLLAGLLLEPRAGVVAALGFAIHILEDELGYLGSNLFAPFTRGRGAGLRLFHSTEPIPNLMTVWLSLTLLFLNMDHVRDVPLLSTGPYLAFVVALPCLLMGTAYVRRQWLARRDHTPAASARQQEALAMLDEAQP